MASTINQYQHSFIEHLTAAQRHFQMAIKSMSSPQQIESVRSHLTNMTFECARAARIARDAAEDIAALGIDVADFRNNLQEVKKNRDTQEHHRDVKKPRMPKSHFHRTPEGLTMAVDETSLILLSPQQIYMGKVNLADIALYIDLQIAIIMNRVNPDGSFKAGPIAR